MRNERESIPGMKAFRIAMAAIVAAVVFLSVPPSHAETAEEMLSACRPITMSKVSDGKIDLPMTYDSGLCWGAFAVLNQAMMLLNSDGSPSLHVCLPESATRTELIAIFVKYVENHPEVYSQNFALTALNAEHKSFPCSKTH